MADLGTTNLYINVPALAREELEVYSTRLFDDWEKYVESTLKLSDYSLSLEIEEGSIKGFGKIAATLGVLYIGIGQYGSFISGLQTIQNQVSTVSNYLGSRAAEPFGATPKITKRGESLTRIKTLFTKVQRGQLTVEEAMQEAEVIFGSELDAAPEFASGLKSSLERAPQDPEQLKLEFVEINNEIYLPSINFEKRTRSPSPRRPVPKPDQYRVEIWRQNKKGKRNIRVIDLN